MLFKSVTSHKKHQNVKEKQERNVTGKWVGGCLAFFDGEVKNLQKSRGIICGRLQWLKFAVLHFTK